MNESQSQFPKSSPPPLENGGWPGGWRDIESAPKDGTLILVYRPLAHETGDPTITIARGTESETTSPQGVKHHTDRWCHPTHWQPLPAPPEAAVSRDGEDSCHSKTPMTPKETA
jgi:hypothetical protein